MRRRLSSSEERVVSDGRRKTAPLQSVGQASRSYLPQLLNEGAGTAGLVAEPADLLADVAAVTTDDFELVEAAERDIDESLDLVVIAVRP